MRTRLMPRVAKLEASIKYMRVAVWALLAYLVLLTWTVYAVQKGLWMAVDSRPQLVEQKLPCSSETNPQCQIYVPTK